MSDASFHEKMGCNGFLSMGWAPLYRSLLRHAKRFPSKKRTGILEEIRQGKSIDMFISKKNSS